MSQCVPSWDLDDSPPARLPFRSRSNSIAPDVPLLDYEVAELTWENGQIAMHGLGPPRVPNKTLANTTTSTTTTTTNSHPCKYWEKPRAGGTLESIVNQATRSSFFPHKPPLSAAAAADELVPWFDHHTAAAAAAAAAAASTIPACSVDAQVPCSHRPHQTDVASCRLASRSSGGGGASVNVGSYTQVASCSGAATQEENNAATAVHMKRSRVARVPPTPEWSGRPDPSVSGTSASLHHMRMDQYSCERDFGVGFASTSLGSPENASSAKPSTKAVTATATATAADDHDSVCHSRLHQRESGDEEEEEEVEDKKKGNGKSSISTKRSRAAAIHNQSERKRRDKINQRMKTLQKLVPNSSKTDKASMLDEVIDYLKQLQAQVQMMSRMNMPAMMLPVAMQQQLQLSMMSPMGMGIGMGMDMNMNMNMNTMGRPNIPGISPAVLHPNPFMSMASWDGSGPADGRLQPQMAAVIPDPLSQFLFACQSQQPMTTEAYSRMAAMYQQLHQPPASSSKS